MCTDYEEIIAWAAYKAALELIGSSVRIGQTELDLPPKEHVRINDTAPIIRAAGNGVELAQMRWSFPPSRPGGRPVFNFRSEGRKFESSRRCLIPTSAFFEFTGDKYPKIRHRFTLVDEPFMCIAGLWRPLDGTDLPAFTMLTTEPGLDIVQYHDRQIVVLPQKDWVAWLYLTKPEADLLRPLPAGSLRVQTEQR